MSSPGMSISGRVVKGIQKGSQIGYPTINIQPVKISRGIEFGVYVCMILIEQRDYKGVMHYGNKSIGTSDIEKIFCEVYVFDFAKDIYGKRVDVNLLKKIRDVRQFDSEEDLVKQIKSDIITANKYFQDYA